MSPELMATWGVEWVEWVGRVGGVEGNESTWMGASGAALAGVFHSCHFACSGARLAGESVPGVGGGRVIWGNGILLTACDVVGQVILHRSQHGHP